MVFCILTLKGKSSPWDLNELYLTNKFGKRISIGAVAEIISTPGPDNLFRYNQTRSVVLSTNLLKNEVFGNAMEQFFEQVSKELVQLIKRYS